MSDAMRQNNRMIPITKPAVVPLVYAGELFGLSRAATYAAAETGEITPGVPVIRVGQRKLVVATSAIEAALDIDLADYLDRTRPAS